MRIQDDDTTQRKGPWTEHEDFQLLFHVHMLGDRRWDFIANVSGLKRSGKSCRLRWVNYLNPGLKRGKLAPHEERLVLELHNKFGNRFDQYSCFFEWLGMMTHKTCFNRSIRFDDLWHISEHIYLVRRNPVTE